MMERLEFELEKKADLQEAKLQGYTKETMTDKLDLLGPLPCASKLMGIVLDGDEMAENYVEDFYKRRYSFLQEGQPKLFYQFDYA